MAGGAAERGRAYCVSRPGDDLYDAKGSIDFARAACGGTELTYA